ncbi:MAG: TAXI family TRAP transporter solute-binding subunit [Thermovirga sp.]|jgi:TRAP transporter TAXI family solute receptor|nr:TAXI family TRAP transporter solute-binding subunit [Thermovirga sp.]
MKKILALALVMVMALAAGASAQTFLSLATGGTGGTYYPIGGGMADVISKALPDVQVTAETGNASQANLNLIGTHQIEMAMVQNDVAAFAYEGKFMFQSPYKNVRAIASLYPETVQAIAMKKSGVTSIRDLPGKRVSVGAPGSGVQVDVSLIFKSLGYKYSDVNADFLDFNLTTERMKDGQLDVGFVVAGYPTASIMDLATLHDMTLIEFDDAMIEDLHAEFPFFVKDVVPAGTYRGVDKDVQTVAVQAMWVCDADLPENLVYRITKAFWENIADVQKVHAKGQLITLDTALDGISVPMHPGAARYYREIGMKVPTF